MFEVESVTVEQPKTATKLSKAADRTLQLDITKKHTLSNKCSQRCEIKILNPKSYDEQLNLTRSSIKNKSFEITKESKEFNFRQNLIREFTKNDEAFKNKILKGPWFDSEKLEFNGTNIDELLDIQHNQLSSRVERWTYERSSWTINLIIQYHFIISENTPYEGSSYFPLPKELRNSVKGLVDIQIEDN